MRRISIAVVAALVGVTMTAVSSCRHGANGTSGASRSASSTRAPARRAGRAPRPRGGPGAARHARRRSAGATAVSTRTSPPRTRTGPGFLHRVAVRPAACRRRPILNFVPGPVGRQLRHASASAPSGVCLGRLGAGARRRRPHGLVHRLRRLPGRGAHPPARHARTDDRARRPASSGTSRWPPAPATAAPAAAWPSTSPSCRPAPTATSPSTRAATAPAGVDGELPGRGDRPELHHGARTPPARSACFSLGDTDVVVDSFGWSAAADGLQLAAPSRLLDTRSGVGWAGGRRRARPDPCQLRVAGRGGVPNDAAARAAHDHRHGRDRRRLRDGLAVRPAPPGGVDAEPATRPAPLEPGPLCSLAARRHGLPVRLHRSTARRCTSWPTPSAGSPAAASRPPAATRHAAAPATAAGGAALRHACRRARRCRATPTCAAQVRAGRRGPAGQRQPNHTKGFGAPANPPAGVYGRVTGNFTGTTDEIIQWAACKWGIDEDIVRAQTAMESWWHQSTVGDNGESFGLMQVRQPYWGWAFNNGNGDAKSSSALQHGRRPRRPPELLRGQRHLARRQLRQGRHVGLRRAVVLRAVVRRRREQYIATVQDYLNQRIWKTPDFLAG